MYIGSVYKKRPQNPEDKHYGVIVSQPPVENLVFEGSGPKGAVYIGAIEVLEARGILDGITNVGGSSSGAMTALVVGLGYNAAEIRRITFEKDWSDLADFWPKSEEVSGFWNKLEKTRSTLAKRLFGEEGKKTGLCWGNNLKDWFTSIIQTRVDKALELEEDQTCKRYGRALAIRNKEDVTFADVAELKTLFPELNIRDISVTGANVTDERLEIFNVHNTPDMPVDLAVRISASFPIFFKNIIYKDKEYTDGGSLNNYPMCIYDEAPYIKESEKKRFQGLYGQNLCTLGFRVESSEEIREILWQSGQEDESGTVQKFLEAIAESSKRMAAKAIMGVDYIAAKRILHEGIYGRYAQRTVQLPDSDYSSLSINLDDQDIKILTETGAKATEEWLSLYYDDAGIEIEFNELSELEEYLNDQQLAEVASKLQALDSPPER